MATTEVPMSHDNPRTSGVQELINRLRDDGVAKGRSEGETLVAEGRQEAALILDKAHAEAEQIVASARQQAEQLKKNAKDALQLAMRDAVLALNEALRTDFAVKVRKLVSHTMQDRAFLERLILEVARRAIPEETGQQVAMLLPNDVLTYEELRKNPKELTENSLSRFVLELSGDILRDGLTFSPGEDDKPGLRVQLKDKDVEIELTDDAVADLLMEHLAPRFRALMERPTT